MPKYVDAYCDLAGFDAAAPDPSFFAHDGSQCSIIRVRGYPSLKSTDEMADILASFGKTCASELVKKGHEITISFERSWNVDALVDDAVQPLREAATRKGLHLELGLSETETILREAVSEQVILIAVWTFPEAAEKTDVVSERQDRDEVLKAIPTDQPLADPFGNLKSLQGPHGSMVRNVLYALTSSGFMAEIIGPDDNGKRRDLAMVRRSILYQETPVDWTPQNTGERRYPATKHRKSEDVSGFFAPTIAAQMMTAAAKSSSDLRSIELGGRKFAFAHLTLMPRHMEAFNDLLANIEETTRRQDNMPFRVTWRLEGGARVNGFKQALATISAFLAPANMNIKNSLDGIQSVMNKNEETVVKVKVLAATWTEPHEDPNLLERRRATLIRALSGWNSPTVADNAPDPLRLLAETAPGMTAVSRTGQTFLAPIGEFALSFPFHRDAPRETEGQTLFLTPDGQIAPFQAHSPSQSMWFSIIIASSGSGKSVLMNAMNIDFAAYSNSTRLPFIGVIDNGISSSGFISTLRTALPHERRAEVRYIKLLNETSEKEYRVNPFDLGLGRRSPLKREETFVFNFLTELLGLGDSDMADGLISAVVSHIYRTSSDLEVSSTPAVWQEDIDPLVDEKARAAGIQLHATTKWWTIVDEFARQGDFVMAERAQRYATPVLRNVMGALSDPNTIETYGDDLCRRARVAVEGATDQYPIFANPTQLDIGESRIVSVDLQYVIQGAASRDASRQDRRNNSLMFMIARHLYMKKVAGEAEEIPSMRFPEDMQDIYRNWWKRRYEDIGQTRKRFCFDEFHTTGGSPAMIQQVMADVRLGRKFGLEITLASQQLDDFESFREMASNIFILDADSEENRVKAQDVFGFSDAVRSALKHRVHGPRPGIGTTFLVGRRTQLGTDWLLAINRLGPGRLWALTTTMEDRYLRDKLYEQTGDVELALDILSRRFPSGSALHLWRQTARTSDSEESVAETLATRLITEHFSTNQRAAGMAAAE